MELPRQDYWLTRDRSEGELSVYLDIWLYRPEYLRYDDGDVTWIAPLELVDRAATFFGSIEFSDAYSQLGASVPDSERECVRVGRGGA